MVCCSSQLSFYQNGVPFAKIAKLQGIPEEDAVAIEAQNSDTSHHESIDIAVIALPRIANFDDFDSLSAETGVRVRYVSEVEAFGTPSAVILPGTKSTVADYQWLESQGLTDTIKAYAEAGGRVVASVAGIKC